MIEVRGGRWAVVRPPGGGIPWGSGPEAGARSLAAPSTATRRAPFGRRRGRGWGAGVGLCPCRGAGEFVRMAPVVALAGARLTTGNGPWAAPRPEAVRLGADRGGLLAEPRGASGNERAPFGGGRGPNAGGGEVGPRAPAAAMVELHGRRRRESVKRPARASDAPTPGEGTRQRASPKPRSSR